jgi:hypothetical protein
MITYKYTNSEKTHVWKYVDGMNVGGGVVADLEYVAWLEKGNIPLPPDEGTE